ncbi:MAG TPA: hypothetical protein VIG64_02310 [Actinomycetota bacterium]|jgi:hypothetical protein
MSSTTAEAARGPTLVENARATFWVFVSLAAGTAGLTLLYLGMRSVMAIGGACADGGPFVPAVRCPEGVPMMILGGVWGGIIFLGIYAWQTIKHHIPSFLAWSWSALFLSLGWNFLEFGLDPPFGEGLAWGWLVCAILFGLMGGIPLVFAVKPVLRGFFDPKPEPERVKPLRPGELKARIAQAAPRSKAKKKKAASATALKTAWQTLREMGTTPTTTASSASPPDSGTEADGMVAALERLQYLHKTGSLTDAEFAAAKARIIEDES